MSKPRSITELVYELQHENETLKGLQRLFNQACRNEFNGLDVKAIHAKLAKLAQLEKRIAEQKAAQAQEQGQ